MTTNAAIKSNLVTSSIRNRGETTNDSGRKSNGAQKKKESSSLALAEVRREAARRHLQDDIRNKEQKFRELGQSIGHRKNVFGDVLEEKATSTKNLLETHTSRATAAML